MIHDGRVEEGLMSCLKFVEAQRHNLQMSKVRNKQTLQEAKNEQRISTN